MGEIIKSPHDRFTVRKAPINTEWTILHIAFMQEGYPEYVSNDGIDN